MSKGAGRSRGASLLIVATLTAAALAGAGFAGRHALVDAVGVGGPASPAAASATGTARPPAAGATPPGTDPLRSTSPWQDPLIRGSAERRAAIADLLDDRAAAVVTGDPAAWMSTVDLADGAAVARETARVASLIALPVDSWSYELGGADRPAGDGPAGAPAGTGSWTVPVVLRYRLAGVDSADVLRPQTVTVGRRDGRWTIRDSGPQAGTADEPVVRDLWDLGPVTVAEGPRSVVVARGEGRDLLAYVAEADDAAVAVDMVWGTGWPRRIAVLVPATQEEIGALVPGATPGLDRVAAVTTGQPEGGGAPTSGDRIVVNPPAWESLSPLGRQIVMTHETTHVATRATSPGDVPLWLSEGFADYIGYRTGQVPVATAAGDLLEEVRAGRVPAGLPAETDFNATSPAVAPAYEGSWLACRLLAQRIGEPALVDLYLATASDGWSAALLESTGLDPPGFVALWQGELTALAQGPA